MYDHLFPLGHPCPLASPCSSLQKLSASRNLIFPLFNFGAVVLTADPFASLFLSVFHSASFMSGRNGMSLSNTTDWYWNKMSFIFHLFLGNLATQVQRIDDIFQVRMVRDLEGNLQVVVLPVAMSFLMLENETLIVITRIVWVSNGRAFYRWYTLQPLFISGGKNESLAK